VYAFTLSWEGGGGEVSGGGKRVHDPLFPRPAVESSGLSFIYALAFFGQGKKGQGWGEGGGGGGGGGVFLL